MKATLIFENEIKFYKAVELVQNLVEDQTFDFNFGKQISIGISKNF